MVRPLDDGLTTVERAADANWYRPEPCRVEVRKDEGFSRGGCRDDDWWTGPRRSRDRIGGWINPERPGKKAAARDNEPHLAGQPVHNRWL